MFWLFTRVLGLDRGGSHFYFLVCSTPPFVASIILAFLRAHGQNYRSFRPEHISKKYTSIQANFEHQPGRVWTDLDALGPSGGRV